MVGHHSPVFYSFRRIVIVYKAVSFNIQAMCSSTVSTITITKVEKFLPLLSLPAASGRFCVRLVNTSCSGSVHKDYLLPLHDSLLIPIHKGYCGCIQVVHAACIALHLFKTQSVNTYYIPRFCLKSKPRYIV